MPAEHPSAFWADAAGAFVVGAGAFDGVLDEPHAVSAPTATIEKTRSATSCRIKRILTSSPCLLRSGGQQEVLGGAADGFPTSRRRGYCDGMEVVRFDVDGAVYGPEAEQVEIVSRKLRAFAGGTYDGEHIAEIGLGTGWVTHAAPVADQIDERLASEGEEPIPLTQDGSALAMYAVLSQTHAEGWDSEQVSEFREALRQYLGIVLGP